MYRRIALVGILTAAVTGLGAVQLLPGRAPVAHADGLTSYGSCENLLQHYRTELAEIVVVPRLLSWAGRSRRRPTAATSSVAGSAARQSGGETGAVGSGPTGTNLQEQGVDEPDLAKLRDGRLVVLVGNRLRVVSAEAQPRLLGSLRVTDQDAWGGELLLVGDRALVVVPGWRQDRRRGRTSPTTRGGSRRTSRAPRPPRSSWSTCPTTSRACSSARSTTGSTSAPGWSTARCGWSPRPGRSRWSYYPNAAGRAAEQQSRDANLRAAGAVGLDALLPQVVRRDAAGTVLEQGTAVSCDRTFHARNASGASTLLVTTLRPSDGLAATDRTAVTTDGDLVYASEDRLYVATSRWGTVAPLADTRMGTVNPATDEVSTQLHAFDITSDTETRYVGSGTVPGYVLGRWALSSHEGALRVATTRQPPWNGDQTAETSSMLVKLAERDGALVETGRVGGLGRTEHIRAVRYFGDIAAVVTFRQTDPLYLVDLSGTPKVLGELKVPGFSTYLHPIGDGLLLGIGQDATKDGQVTGMQVSVFDVSDLTQPALRDRLPLGQGWSAALDDSRAFGYDPQRRQAMFAFTGYDQSIVASTEQSSALGVTVSADGQLSLAGQLDLAARHLAAAGAHRRRPGVRGRRQRHRRRRRRHHDPHRRAQTSDHPGVHGRYRGNAFDPQTTQSITHLRIFG